MLGLVVLSSCEKEDEDPMGPSEPNLKTITQTAVDNGDFTILVSALQRTGLDQVLDASGTYTVFAPNDQAFLDLMDALEADNLEELSVALGGDAVLTNILLYHVLGATVESADVSTGWVSTLSELNGGNMDYLSAYLNVGSKVMINDAEITGVDVMCTNGVIHILNKVIVPMNIAEMATIDSRLSILLDVVAEADAAVLDRLTGTAVTTLFAPRNEAFVSVLEELDYNNLNEMVMDLGKEGITNVLLYRAVDGNVRSTDLSDTKAPPLLGDEIEIMTSGPSIKDANDRVSNILIADIQGTNGVVHVVEKVLLP